MATHKNTTDRLILATDGCFRPPCSCKDIAVTNALQAVRHLLDAHDGRFSDVFPNDLLPMACLEFTKGLAKLNAMRSNPWLWSKASLPCKCKRLVTPNALLVCQHIYDTHVRDRGDWSIEELLGFVDSVTERWLRTPAATEWILSPHGSRMGDVCHACGGPLPTGTPRGQDCKKCQRARSRAN